MKRRIVVLFHEQQRGTDISGYSVTRFYPIWRADGHEVVEVFGTDHREPGDLLFLHVDLSEVPEPYLAYAGDYPASVNGRVGSILKSSFTPYLLRPGDPWAGPVMVKSNRNYGGIPEAVFGVPRLDGSGLTPPFGSPMAYQVFPSLAEVPEQAFRSADIIVQRFLPECADGLFHVRAYSFLGSWERCTLAGSRNPIVKEGTRETFWKVPVHPDLPAWRRRLGLDYGKLDYVLHQGEAILLDVNKTMGSGGAHDPQPRPGSSREARARGVYALFR